jgi:hypothetical protein
MQDVVYRWYGRDRPRILSRASLIRSFSSVSADGKYRISRQVKVGGPVFCLVTAVAVNGQWTLAACAVKEARTAVVAAAVGGLHARRDNILGIEGGLHCRSNRLGICAAEVGGQLVVSILLTTELHDDFSANLGA